MLLIQTQVHKFGDILDYMHRMIPETDVSECVHLGPYPNIILKKKIIQNT